MAKKLQERIQSIIQCYEEAYIVIKPVPMDPYKRILEPHEPCGGTGRKRLSHAEGAYIYLPRYIHDLVHRQGIGEKLDEILSSIVQEEWFKHKVMIEDYTWMQAWEEWMDNDKFGKNYTDYWPGEKMSLEKIDPYQRIEPIMDEIKTYLRRVA